MKGRHRQQTWLDTSTRGQGLSRQHEWYQLCKLMTSATFLYEHRLKKISGNMYGTRRHALFHWKLQVHVFSGMPYNAMGLIPHFWEPTGAIRDHLLISAIDCPAAHIISNKLWTCLSQKGYLVSGADQSHKESCPDSKKNVSVFLTATMPKGLWHVLQHCSIHCTATRVVHPQ